MSDYAQSEEFSNSKLKRKRKEKKENIIKNKKVKGEEHINHKNKLVAARKIGPDCRFVSTTFQVIC